MSDIGISLHIELLRYPLMAINVDFRRVNLNFVRMKRMTSEYFSPLLLDIRFSILLFKRRHSFPITPFVRNTSGVKVAFSTSKTRWLYCIFFFFHYHHTTSQWLCSYLTGSLGEQPLHQKKVLLKIHKFWNNLLLHKII